MTRRTVKTREARRAIMDRMFWKTGGAIIEGDKIQYDYSKSYNGKTMIFRAGPDRRKDCFMLMVEPDHSAVLQGMKQAADCALDPGGTGRTLVVAAVNLARKHKATTLQLTDNSKKHISVDHVFSLANLYFLSYGQTWYESLIPGLYPIEKVAKIQLWRERAHSNRWVDIAARVPPLPVAIDDIDVSEPGSAMKVIQRIKDSRSTYFAEYEDELLNASNIGSLYGITWETRL